jgi:hypothetical protein
MKAQKIAKNLGHKRKIGKCIWIFLVFTIMATSFFALQGSGVNAASWSATDETLTVAEKLFQLDLSRYHPKIVNVNNEASVIGEQVSVMYTLGNVTYYPDGGVSSREIDFDCVFVNKSLIRCSLYVNTENAIFFTQPQPVKYADMARNFLNRYQNYTQSTYIQSLSNMLGRVNISKNTELIVGDIKLEIKVDGVFTNIQWTQLKGGLETYNSVSIIFKKGYLHLFGDSWLSYQVNMPIIKVSRDQAISIAKESANKYPLKISYDGRSWSTVKFSLMDEPVNAVLSLRIRENTMQPFWQIQVYLDKIYSWTYTITVGIWADTGEVEYCDAQGGGGMGLPSHWGLEHIRPNNLTKTSNYNLSKVIPAIDTTNVPINAAITIVWTEPPPVQQIQLTPEIEIDYILKDTFECNTTTWYFVQPLNPSTTYVATITFGEHGNTKSSTWEFTTETTTNNSYLPSVTPTIPEIQSNLILYLFIIISAVSIIIINKSKHKME